MTTQAPKACREAHTPVPPDSRLTSFLAAQALNKQEQSTTSICPWGASEDFLSFVPFSAVLYHSDIPVVEGFETNLQGLKNHVLLDEVPPQATVPLSMVRGPVAEAVVEREEDEPQKGIHSIASELLPAATPDVDASSLSAHFLDHQTAAAPDCETLSVEEESLTGHLHHLC